MVEFKLKTGLLSSVQRLDPLNGGLPVRTEEQGCAFGPPSLPLNTYVIQHIQYTLQKIGFATALSRHRSGGLWFASAWLFATSHLLTAGMCG